MRAHDHATAGDCLTYVGYVHLRNSGPGKPDRWECTMCAWTNIETSYANGLHFADLHDRSHRAGRVF